MQQKDTKRWNIWSRGWIADMEWVSLEEIQTTGCNRITVNACKNMDSRAVLLPILIL